MWWDKLIASWTDIAFALLILLFMAAVIFVPVAATWCMLQP